MNEIETENCLHAKRFDEHSILVNYPVHAQIFVTSMTRKKTKISSICTDVWNFVHAVELNPLPKLVASVCIAFLLIVVPFLFVVSVVPFINVHSTRVDVEAQAEENAIKATKHIQCQNVNREINAWTEILSLKRVRACVWLHHCEENKKQKYAR